MNQDELKRFVHYDENTGVFTRIGFINGYGQFVNKTTEFTTVSNEGYIIIRINNVAYKAHRLVHLYVDGVQLTENDYIDHIDGNRSNNRYSNLRIVSRDENLKNKRLYRTNTTGYIGVSKFGKYYRARININGKRKSLGLFDDPYQAYLVRKEYEEIYGYHENHGSILNESKT